MATVFVCIWNVVRNGPEVNLRPRICHFLNPRIVGVYFVRFLVMLDPKKYWHVKLPFSIRGFQLTTCSLFLFLCHSSSAHTPAWVFTGSGAVILVGCVHIVDRWTTQEIDNIEKDEDEEHLPLPGDLHKLCTPAAPRIPRQSAPTTFPLKYLEDLQMDSNQEIGLFGGVKIH